MDWKKLLVDQGMKVIQDPRLQKMMTDERVMKAVAGAFQLRGKIQESFDDRVAHVAKSLGLVTKEELRDLRRTMRKMEDELREARRSAGTRGDGGGGSR